jgi:enoyl-CoA hydratase/carnithine racemase
LSLTDKVILERHEAVTELRLNREEFANAIDVEMALGIAAAIDEYAADDRARAVVGYSNAMWMITTGCRVDAERAHEIGLVQEVVPVGQARLRALDVAREVAELPQPALVADRNATVASIDTPLSFGLDVEAEFGRAVMRNPEVVERLETYRQRRN